MAFDRTVTLLRRPALGQLLILCLHLASLGLFIHGFLLTRVHLPQRARDPPPSANLTGGAPFDRVVWLMIDALRYDFVVADKRYTCASGGACHQGHMPFLSALAANQDAARSFLFAADAPTTTTQRLASLATGGLPSFFDVSNAFSAGAVADDNLVEQLAAAGGGLVFLGDTTWAQLFPHAWAWSRPYPCFNVKDLHTVDEGVAAHLPPALRAPASWGRLLVAHYLGADHCGHTHGVASDAMASKLRRLDDQVRQVAEALAAGAGAGGPYARTLLLVSGDHGQTLGGDHGGGSPEEVDSALVAVDVAALRGGGSGGGGSTAAAADACRASCTCGVERNQCAPDLAQVDLAPSLAALLGVPIPFASLGRLSPELWQLAAPHVARAGADWRGSLADALKHNARQACVHTYLNAYAAAPGTRFSRTALAALNRQYGELDGGEEAAPEEVAARCTSFLDAALAVARHQWAQFRDLPMAAGLALLAASLALHAAAAFGGSGGGALLARWSPGSGLHVPTLGAWLAAAVGAHALGTFSFFYLLSEGTAVCSLVAAACLALAAATGRAAWGAGQRLRGVVGLGVMSLRCNAAMALLGLAHHTGQGFWHRLTVHDPQPAADVERGLQGKLAMARRLGSLLLARTGLDGMSPATLALAQHSLLCTLPLALLGLAVQRSQRGLGAGRPALLPWLAAGALACAAAYLQVEEAEGGGFLPADASAEALARAHSPALAAGLATLAQLARVSPRAASLAARLASLPLRVLLPHGAYALCAAAAALWLRAAASRRLRGVAAATAAAQVLLPLVVLVSSRRTPLILLLGLLLLAAAAKLCARRAELRASVGGGSAAAGEAAALVALVAVQMFYVTGHLCEFAGLEYTAGFVGSDEFHLWRSAALMALNTFGPMLLALLALPAILRHVAAAANAPAPAAPAGGQAKEAGSPAAQGTDTHGAVRQGSQAGQGGPAAAVAGLEEAGCRQQPLLVAGLVRAAAAFCATLSAAVQRRHLYAWALFAPKFAFEACFLLLTDAVLLLLALLG